MYLRPIDFLQNVWSLSLLGRVNSQSVIQKFCELVHARWFIL